MNTTVTPTQTGVRVSIPMKVRKPRGKTVILLPDMPRYIQREPRRDYQEAVAVAVARGHLWCEMLESGKFSSLREMAAKFGLCESYMARLVRTASLAPDIVEAIFAGTEPTGFSISSLIMAMPDVWEEQRREHGFA
ncbi:MAG: hypothetical protein M1133_16480 [Armatimonadetes bacterium]|nr:hypothetical protein [Armatimonadota bacterium]